MPPVISFISFKGGAGRSVALANTAYQLARNGRNVGCVDFDIEGGGLHTVFEVGDNSLDSIQQFLMNDEAQRIFFRGKVPDYTDEKVFKERLVIDVVKATSNDWRHRAAPGDGGISLIQAQPDARATSLVDTSGTFFHRFNLLLKVFARVCKLDCILVDCRSGISTLALPGLAYSDLTVVILRWGSQHRYGTARLVKWYREWLKEGDIDTKVIVVPSGIDPGLVKESEIIAYCKTTLGEPDAHPLVVPFIPYLMRNDVILWVPDGPAGAGDDMSERAAQAEHFKKLAAKLWAAVPQDRPTR